MGLLGLTLPKLLRAQAEQKAAGGRARAKSVIFLFMAGLAAVVTLWAYFRLAESLAPENRRPLHPKVVAQGFALEVDGGVAGAVGMELVAGATGSRGSLVPVAIT